MSRITVQGADLECVDAGSEEPVVLVHGSVSDMRTWAHHPPAEFLGSGFVALDDERVRHVFCPTLLLRSQNSPGIFGVLVGRLVELIPGGGVP